MKPCSEHPPCDRPANGHAKEGKLPLQGDSHDRLASGDVSAVADAKDLPANLQTRKYTGSANPNYSVCAFVLPEPN